MVPAAIEITTHTVTQTMGPTRRRPMPGELTTVGADRMTASFWRGNFRSSIPKHNDSLIKNQSIQTPDLINPNKGIKASWNPPQQVDKPRFSFFFAPRAFFLAVSLAEC